MSKECKESIGTITHQVEYVNKEISFMKKKQTEILVLKSTITEMKGKKNPLDKFNSRFDLAKEKNPPT